jgi:RHS repeat-associated protein
MKRYSIFFLFLNVFWTAHSQSSIPSQDQNYIKTRTYTKDDGSTYLDAVQYFDGLLRPMELIQVGVTPNKADLITCQEYDNFGRDSRSWLPTIAVENQGAFMALPDFQTKSTATYNNTIYNSAADTEPYAYPVYENSPLNRVTEQYGAGDSWHTGGKAVKTAYLTNGAIVIPRFTTTNNTKMVEITRSGNYAPNTLYITELTDEDGRMSYEAKNKLGQLVCTVQQDGSTLLYTSYVYDSFGNKRAMIPPEAVSRFSSGTWTEDTPLLKTYCYVYKYDSRQRTIAKQIPGAEWIYYVYDKADRLIFSQDGEQRKKNNGSGEWLFTIPDVFGRTVLTGTCTNTMTYTDNPLATTAVVAERTNATDDYKGYSISGITPTSPTILSVNYYDNYAFRGTNGISNAADFSCESTSDYGTHYTGSYKGLLTGTMTAILDDSATPTYIYSILYYDSKDRVIQSKSTNYLTGGIDQEYILYDFTGHLLKRKTVHSATGQTRQTELYTYTYDHAGRQLTATHQLNDNAPMLLSNNHYDELGRLKTITHASPQSLPLSVIPVNPHIRGRIINTEEPTALSIAYRYNIRNWLTDIDSNPFTENLTYTSIGNVETMRWKQQGDYREYEFTYDNLSRLTAAEFSGNRSNENFSTTYRYDKHGNMTHLTRHGQTGGDVYGIIDDLTYNYNNSNQVQNITDAGQDVTFNISQDFKDYTKGDGTEYDYNANGAMIRDLNKGISALTYNILNLPRKMDIKSPVAEARNEYVYSAGGQKLKVIQQWNPDYSATPTIGSDINAGALPLTKTTNYTGNKIYENDTLKMILTDNGYFDYLENKYYFYIRDHLGNNRAVADQNSKIVQSTQYYPFGMAMSISTGQDKQPFKFGNKEFDPMFGLNIYDQVARGLDPVTGQFTTNDPLAEKYPWISPRAFALNNPLKYIDPTGKFIDTLWDAASLALGINSFVDNVQSGNVGGAIADGFGVVLDAAAVVVPFVPGGAGVAIKAARTADKVVDAVKTANKIDNAVDGAKAMNKAGDATKVNVYRVYGKDAKAKGFSWTTENPNKVSNYRDKAGLPSGKESGKINSGQFVIEGNVKRKDIIRTQPADALDGNKGGLPELIIDPKKVEIQRVSGANPSF